MYTDVDNSRQLIAQARALLEELGEIHRRMTRPDDDFEAINSYRLDQVEDMLVAAQRRVERRQRSLQEA